MEPLTGDSILFSPSHKLWSSKRKVIAAAFYKEKMLLMCELIKETAHEVTEDWRKDFVQKSKPFNIFEAVIELQTDILTCCAFGRDCRGMEMPVKMDGKMINMPWGQAVRHIFDKCLYRMIQPHLLFFPELSDIWFTTTYDRDLKQNIQQLRNFISDIVQKRRAGNSKASFNNQNDLLDILLNEDVFEQSDKNIIDECITFFFAGA